MLAFRVQQRGIYCLDGGEKESGRLDKHSSRTGWNMIYTNIGRLIFKFRAINLDVCDGTLIMRVR